MNTIKTLTHHCVMHPLAGVAYVLTLESLGDWLHNLVHDPGTGPA